MMLKFDHTHYVPVLRFKRSEKVALRQLATQARAGITPLLEIVPTAGYAPMTVANEIRIHWGLYPFLLRSESLARIARRGPCSYDERGYPIAGTPQHTSPRPWKRAAILNGCVDGLGPR